MRIGEVAEIMGIPASTIRYYEQVGLLEPPPRVSGVRHFGAQAIYLLRFVQLAQAAGFSIAEIKSLMERSDEGLSPASLWKNLARDKREAVRRQINDLKQVERILTELLACRCESLERCVESACGTLPAGDDSCPG